MPAYAVGEADLGVEELATRPDAADAVCCFLFIRARVKVESVRRT